MSFKNAHQAIQKVIRNYSVTNFTPETVKAIIQASSLNTTINAIDIVKTGGKKRELKISYWPPICDVEGDCNDNVCNDGEVLEPLQDTFELKQCTASKVFAISFKDLRNIDDTSNNDVFLEQNAAVLQAFRELLNKQMATYVAGHVGCHTDGSSVKKTAVLTPNNVINPVGVISINKEYSDAHLGTPYVIGGDSVFYARGMAPYASTTATGINPTNVPLNNWYYDSTIDSVYGTGQNLIAFDPRMLKFMAYNENSGEFATNLGAFTLDLFRSGETFYKGTIYDPQLGLLLDLNAKYDDCNDVWKFQYKLVWDIFFMPRTSCTTDCFNGITHWTTCDLPNVECPTITPEPLPIKNNYTAAYTLSCTPFNVLSLEVNGMNFKPNSAANTLSDLAAMISAESGIIVTASGSNLLYTGYQPLQLSINDTPVTFA